jgi:hypothetical protein
MSDRDRLSIGADIVEAAREAFDGAPRNIHGTNGRLEAAIREALDKLGLREERRVRTERTPFPSGPQWLRVEHRRLASHWRQVDAEPLDEPRFSPSASCAFCSGDPSKNVKGSLNECPACRRKKTPPSERVDTEPSERVTHGRHCICSACAAQDWAEPGLAPCGMHGPSCPPLYAPLGAAGDVVQRPSATSEGEPRG